MDQDLYKLVKENHKLLLENLDIARENQKKIKKIQSHIRRTMVVKSIYWLIIIAVTISAFYYSKPYIEDAIEKYDTVKENINRSNSIISDPGALFNDINIVERLFGTE